MLEEILKDEEDELQEIQTGIENIKIDNSDSSDNIEIKEEKTKEIIKISFIYIFER